jgi:hypothetical protein
MTSTRALLTCVFLACGSPAASEHDPSARSASSATASESTPARSARATSFPEVAPEEPPVPLAPRPEPPLSKEALAKVVADARAPVTAEVFEAALLSLEACKLERGFSARGCDERKALDVLRARPRSGFREVDVAARHLRHPAAAVRERAASIVGSRTFGSFEPSGLGSPEGKAFVAALRSETEAPVLQTFLSLSGDAAAKSETVRYVVLRALEHEDTLVRFAAIDRLAVPSVYAEVPRAYDVFVRLVTSGATEAERGYACAAFGKTDDERAFATIRAELESAATPPEVRGGCFEGVVQLWIQRPFPRNPNRAAYELTLQLLTRTPRDADMPHNRGVLALALLRFRGAVSTEEQEWLEKTQGWYRRADLQAALESIVLDPAASVLTRDVAIFVLAMWGEETAVTELANKLERSQDPEGKRLAAKAREELARQSR